MGEAEPGSNAGRARTGQARRLDRLRPRPLRNLSVVPGSTNPGYLMRGMHLLPKRGNKPEWLHSQDYEIEKELLPAADLEDGSLDYASEAPRLKSPLSRLRVLSGRG